MVDWLILMLCSQKFHNSFQVILLFHLVGLVSQYKSSVTPLCLRLCAQSVVYVWGPDRQQVRHLLLDRPCDVYVSGPPVR